MESLEVMLDLWVQTSPLSEHILSWPQTLALLKWVWIPISPNVEDYWQISKVRCFSSQLFQKVSVFLHNKSGSHEGPIDTLWIRDPAHRKIKTTRHPIEHFNYELFNITKLVLYLHHEFLLYYNILP